MMKIDCDRDCNHNPAARTPRAKDGKLNLTAPAPRISGKTRSQRCQAN